MGSCNGAILADGAAESISWMGCLSIGPLSGVSHMKYQLVLLVFDDEDNEVTSFVSTRTDSLQGAAEDVLHRYEQQDVEIDLREEHATREEPSL
jgi:hypothetical protein